MASPKRKASKSFLSDYRIDSDSLLNPKPEVGRPGLQPALDPDGRSVLVKFWDRADQGRDNDLEQIWRSEIRQLQRLAAVPRAEELFVPMVASGEDDEGFYLVLDPGQASPLETFRRAATQPPIMTQYRLPRNRRRLWANAKRAAEALELLHSQGVIHRNVDPWAILTTFGDQPDFRLTGFEWSMRLAAADLPLSAREPSEGKDSVASFGRDWTNLGIVVAELVGAPLDRVSNLRLVPSDIAEHLSAAEGKLLRSMMRIETAERLDGEEICRRMEDVVLAITAEAAGREAKSAVALRLGRGSKLAETIRGVSDNEIEMADAQSQMDFIEADLSAEPYFVRVRQRSEEEPSFALLGQSVTYWLEPFRVSESSEAADWEFATCERAQRGRLPSDWIEGSVALEWNTLDLVDSRTARDSFPRRRGKVARWSDCIAQTEPKQFKKTDLDRMHEAFSLLLALEMAYAAADVFPVEVPSRAERSSSGESYVLTLSSRYDRARAELSTALALEAPAVRLTKMLESDDLVQQEGSWILTETGELGDHTDETEWRFLDRSEADARERLRFDGAAPAEPTSVAYLSPPGMAGQLAQFRRRRKALKVLREHTELLRMLADPRSRIDDSHDPLNEKETRFKELDESKKGALREILSTVPLFFLQGPPGVGKTFLVGDIVKRRFEDDPTARMLLSAQSNAAIDHLMKEIQSSFGEDSSTTPVMVRARPADDDPSDTDLEIDRQADRHLQALAKSPLVAEASSGLQQKVIALAQARQELQGGGRRSARRNRMSAEGRAFEGMILRSANLVFATTNSAAVDRLIEERSLFDWTIIEEAGKATGGELLSPLLLSHRRLMIGDHKQLPPYNVERMTRLLSVPDKVKAAVGSAQELISRHLKDPGLEDLFDEIESESDDFGRLCSQTLSILTMFESMVEAEFARKAKARREFRPIARRLEEQYRMHPAIAKIVSNCFYDGKLSTNDKKADEYRTKKPPLMFGPGATVPDAPIVFVDMPFVRAARGYRGGERAPPWSNPDEVKAALHVLSQLRAREGEKPSLAVLSPYREQVRSLRSAINGEAKTLGHLSSFKPAVGDGEFFGTVDSFQGDQADLVLISLVRNNGHGAPAKALGFLRDNRRMNVLLSRAKWRLVMVGSLAFYRNVVEVAQGLPESDIGFMKRFLAAFDEADAAGEAKIIPWSELTGAGS
ncbi:AAA domain-containing protein (plasmid) [Bradyrhizobium sp. CCGUVB1N3]|uniref:AAA domain-containing protein n=1 Tax=Bradyrhizobium sp. CCGUVB1N3 TaxID=2949629 RepID=UPI0020B1F665|nr:AAA domain-containing protein [Bradyrhizobium sp. CCGUVB1N3]MCP3477947.1 AAA domain-containing protein [Bradyrhizobium sp. CCGUVB1N3]